MNFAELLEKAREARANAYAPYSGFAVGAALLTEDGTIFTGANIENASYGLAVCAERVAVLKAVSEGQRRFQALAVTAEGEDYCLPCGACRQMIVEFAADMPLILGKAGGAFRVANIREFLPLPFLGKGLERDSRKGEKHE